MNESDGTTTSSPGERRLVTEPSMAPVPEAASTSTSWPVPKSSRSPSCTSASISPNCGVRWWITGSAIAAITSGGTGVGPGASR